MIFIDENSTTLARKVANRKPIPMSTQYQQQRQGILTNWVVFKFMKILSHSSQILSVKSKKYKSLKNTINICSITISFTGMLLLFYDYMNGTC